ncbi:conserved oligomeric Golgi complex subunit 3-like [Homarus americanus]|uniref:Conserved oligomeric Golgi complex subunit 3 n=1 Tax=Homarus americanus TaxID=6706 RepID=A0A8J5N1G0_HOMAM|nr:conserved oligomeric Golgi complex subunit 3-like [Homarus americanus]KAG7171455.1 Conserved oligomeric Golgi complex subunit 3-like [Homarus americanus]
MEDVAEVNTVRVRDHLAHWEDDRTPLAPLMPQERDSIIELTSVSVWRALPSGIEDEEDRGDVLDSTRGGPKADTLAQYHLPDSLSRLKLGDVKIESSQQFLSWFAGVEREMCEEHDGPYRDYVKQLKAHRSECHTLLAQLDHALDNLQYLSSQYTSVSNKTGALHTDCEHLLAEQTRLTNKADTIESKLTYFREVDRISQKLNSPAFQVTSEGFIPLLAKIDECIGYMNGNPSFQESSLYLAKYKHCLSRALGMVKSYVTKSLENATQQVSSKPGTEKPTTDNAAVLYYGKFRTNAPRIKSLMAEIEDRVENSPEYTTLLSDCHQCYFSQRQRLMGPCVNDAVAQLSQKYERDYCKLVRSGCAFLIHVCEDEHTLFHQFFTAGTPDLDGFLQGLCTGLYDVLRPHIIHVDHLETLSELCNILRRGMIEEHLQNNPTQLAPLTSVVNQMLEDAQERLVYRTHIYINTDIANFRPSPGDLAYPGKLQLMETIADGLANQRKMHSRNASVSSMSSVRSATSEEVASITGAADERFSRVGTSPADLHGMWYPTVRRTLMCLFKLYRCVDRSIFQGVSLEALAACMQSLSLASSSISKTSSPLDAQLFEIKHLLILREQMAPFQVDACLHETSLDWSKVRTAALGLMQKRGRLFSLSSTNALLEFIVEGTPQVMEQRLDSKRDLDNRLKKLCELLIFTCTETLSSPLIMFLTKAEVILQMNQEETVKPIMLKNQPFAVPEKVADVMSSCQKNIRTHLPNIQRSMQLYLANRDTEFILFKPVRINVLGSFSRVQNILVNNYSEDDRIIIACPSQEEVSVLLSSLFKS